MARKNRCQRRARRNQCDRELAARLITVKPNPSPWTITGPCSADWDKMQGDDKRRFCEHCQKIVHNVSAMNEKERAKFAKPLHQHECVIYFQRSNGKIADLSFLSFVRRWFPFLRVACWSALVALLPVTLTGCMGRCIPPRVAEPVQTNGTNAHPRTRTRPAERPYPAINIRSCPDNRSAAVAVARLTINC
jgi:hypothetical protein